MESPRYPQSRRRAKGRAKKAAGALGSPGRESKPANALAGGADIASAAMSASRESAHPAKGTVGAPPEIGGGDPRSAGRGAAATKADAHVASGFSPTEGHLPRPAGGQVPVAATIPRPALNLLPYQRRWVEDASPLKIVVKARQIGYSFAATLRAVLRCLEHKTTWIFLSKGERQSRLLMEKVQEHIRSCGVVAEARESAFFEGTMIKQLETRFPNGSVIYGLPANPDTARGYSGNVTLDEFAFHSDAEKIYAALYPSITRGYSLEIISTPNGQQGKFYELAKAAGLCDQVTGEKAQVTGDRLQVTEKMRAHAGLPSVPCPL